MTTTFPDEEYRGWTITDRGEDYHPITARFNASRYGVDFQARDLPALKRVIDRRIREYPSSGGA